MTKEKKAPRPMVFRGVVIGGVVAVSVLITTLLFATEEPPAKAERRERAIRVELIEAARVDVPVTMGGFGEVRARDTVDIAPEVPGRVTLVHPRLEVGELIDAGEVLFEIDPRDYEARLQEANATVDQLTNALERLRQQYAIDQERLKTYVRTSEVSQNEYLRVKSLYENDQVGTQSNVDQSEMAYNNAKDAADRLRQAVALYPSQIKEAEAALNAAQARADLAAISLERTRITAPFRARVKRVSVEAGQYIAPGAPVLTLADDSLLEISVSLNSQDARRWLQFESDATAENAGWFRRVKQVPVDIYWTEGAREAHWVGRLNRVEKFDESTRTVEVAVQVLAKDVLSTSNSHIPLVEGMFCRVEIPGKVAEDVIKVPVSAVAFDRDASGYRTAYLADQTAAGEYRLKSVRVRESHLDGQYIYLTEGIEKGDLIVGTRLVNPLERSLLSVTAHAQPAQEETGS